MTKNNKKNNLHTRQHVCLVKSIAALSLSAALQACAKNSQGATRMPSSNKSVMDYILHTNDATFRDELDDRKNISRRWKGHDLLYGAVRASDENKVKLILERVTRDKRLGVAYKENSNFPNAVNGPHNKTSLGKAVEKKNKAIIEALLNNEYIDVNNIDVNGQTVLLLALNLKDEKLAQFVLEVCPNHKLDLAAKDPTGSTALHLAIKYGFNAFLTSLLNKLQSVDSLCLTDKKNRMPLHLAARGNMKQAFEQLFVRICELCDSQDAIRSKLFAKDIKGHSLFARAYLPKHTGRARLLDFNKSAMFKFVLRTVEQCLQQEQVSAIGKEITKLEGEQVIGQPQAAVLRKILIKQFPNADVFLGNEGLQARTVDTNRAHAAEGSETPQPNTTRLPKAPLPPALAPKPNSFIVHFSPATPPTPQEPSVGASSNSIPTDPIQQEQQAKLRPATITSDLLKKQQVKLKPATTANVSTGNTANGDNVLESLREFMNKRNQERSVGDDNVNNNENTWNDDSEDDDNLPPPPRWASSSKNYLPKIATLHVEPVASSQQHQGVGVHDRGAGVSLRSESFLNKIRKRRKAVAGYSQEIERTSQEVLGA